MTDRRAGKAAGKPAKPALGELDERLRLRPQPKAASKRRLMVAVAAVALMVLSFWVILNQQGSGPSPFSVEAWQRFWNLLERFAGSGLPEGVTPAYFQGHFWEMTLRQSLDTLEMSLLAIAVAGFGIIVAVLVFQPAGRSPKGRKRLSYFSVIRTLTGWLFVLTRSIPEYIWALIVVLVFKPGIFAGALALGIHNFGVLGRLTSGTISSNLASGTNSADTSQASQLALTGAGASQAQLLAYGILPTYALELITFYLYRWEVIIRTSIVVGFVTNAGLGLSLRLALSFRFFTEMAGIIIAYFVLVLAVDLIAAGLRRLSKVSY